MSKRILVMLVFSAVITLCVSCANSAGSPSSAPTPTSSAAIAKEINAKAKTLKSDGDDKLEVIADLVDEWPEWVETIEQTVDQIFSGE